jgi:tetratricopeptide (TPR) repeat protein
MKVQIILAGNKSKLRVAALFLVLVVAAGGAAGWQLHQQNLREQEFSKNFAQALRSKGSGEFRDAIDAANRAMLIKPDADLARLVQDCNLRLIESDLQKKLTELETATYAPAAEAAAYELKRAALEKRVTDLAATGETKELTDRRLSGLLGRVAFFLGDFESAQTSLLKAMPPGPVDPKVQLTLVRSYFMRLVQVQAVGRVPSPDNAGKRLQAVELRHGMAEALSRSVMQGRTPMEEEVAEVYRSISKDDKEGARLLAEQGVERHAKVNGGEEFRALLAWASTEAEALQDLDKAVEQRPHQMLTYLVRGWRRQEASDLLGAVADYSQLIRLSPGSPMAHLLRGRVRRLQGDLENALPDLVRCRTIASPGWEFRLELENQLGAVQGNQK